MMWYLWMIIGCVAAFILILIIAFVWWVRFGNRCDMFLRIDERRAAIKKSGERNQK